MRWETTPWREVLTRGLPACALYICGLDMSRVTLWIEFTKAWSTKSV